MLQKKRPQSNEGEGTPKAKCGRPKQSLWALALTRYPPLRDACTGDDNTTLSRNIELLHKELQASRPRKEVVLTLAAQTYNSRREAVLSECEEVSATSLLATYSELKKLYMVREHDEICSECHMQALYWIDGCI